MKIKLLLSILSLIFSVNLVAQQEITVYSQSMKKYIKNYVYLPSDYDKTQSDYPVLYLLHGYSGTYKTWQVIDDQLLQDATKYNMIIVTPDGNNNWYWDSPIDSKIRYETYVSEELVNYVDSAYHTIPSPKGRAITGFSMGGHGSLWLAINHPDIFGACGSMSGGLDIRPFPDNWNIKNVLGKYRDNTEEWDSHTVINQLNKIEPNSLSIIIDCGTSDFFYEVNKKTHDKMEYLNIPHDFISRPGTHDNKYWANAIKTQLIFFDNYFQNKKSDN